MSNGQAEVRNGYDLRWNDVSMVWLAPLVAFSSLTITLATFAQQSSILVTFDLHVDPVNNGFPEEGKAAVFQTRTEWMEWVLDQTESHSIPLSFLSSGWYMERVVNGGPLGNGAVLVRRMYATGGQIGSHHHNEFRRGDFDWPNAASDVPFSLVHTQWKDNIEWVNAGIKTAFWGTPPVAVEDINRVKGAHAPNDEIKYHQLMNEFGFDVREPGPEEDYYGYFGHHIWHPYRPSVSNHLAEDLNTSFVQIPAGPIIGHQSVHHGTMQDMRAAAMKRQFLQIYLNWRNANRTGSDPKVWTWGWASHANDFDPTATSREDLLEVLSWMASHFRNRREPDGSLIMQYATHLDVADAYLNWETANPEVSSFSFDSLIEEDWTTYPWLRAVAEEMRNYLWESDLTIPGVEAFQLDRDGSDAVLLWSNATTVVNVDLTTIFTERVRVVGLDSGLTLSGGVGTPANQILVANEPLWITAVPEPATLLLLTLGMSAACDRRRCGRHPPLTPCR